jgi:hypothetical protein
LKHVLISLDLNPGNVFSHSELGILNSAFIGGRLSNIVMSQGIYLNRHKKMTFNFNANRLQASRLLGISIETVKKWEYTGKIPAHVYTKFGYKTVRYCLPLLQEWQLNPGDIEVQARSAAALAASLSSTQPARAGRKSTAA